MRVYAEGNQNQFAQLTGLQQSQISQMAGYKRPISDKIWLRIHDSLGIKDQTLPEDYEQLRQYIEITKNMIHQGRQLEEYMARNGITNVEAAKKLNVSPAMVSIYKTSEQFRPEVANRINKGLSVNDDPVFYGLPPANSNSLQDLPLITDSMRNLTDFNKCPRYEITSKLEYDLKGGIVIQIETDFMEPSIRKGSELLGIAVPESKYKYHTGLTAIHYADMIAIGEVHSNDILDKGYITLHRGNSKVLRVLKEDIQHLWHIVLGLNVKF